MRIRTWASNHQIMAVITDSFAADHKNDERFNHPESFELVPSKYTN